MTVTCFLDTNVLVYAASNAAADQAKRFQIQQLNVGDERKEAGQD